MKAINSWVAEATVITREAVIKQALEKAIRWRDAALILGITPRQMRRVRKRYLEQGQAGLKDRRKFSGRRSSIPEAERKKVIRLKQEMYKDFNVRHFFEFATEKHHLKASYGWTLKVLQEAKLTEKLIKRGTYRRRRPRRPMRGMMLHLDASTHAWLGPEQPEWDLNLVVDDADGRLLFGRFVPEEGTLSTMEALWYVLTQHGRFGALYTDRGSHFLPKDPVHEGQVQRALKQLSIQHIAAHSPQARGRSERVFRTVQSRLIPELRLAKITSYEAANRYLEEIFIPDYNQRFAVEPSLPGAAFSAPPPIDLHLVLSIQKQRQVRNDYTVHYQTMKLQLPNSDDRPLPGRAVNVHTFIDETLGISYRNRLLACYTAEGDPVTLPEKPSPWACVPTQPQPTRPDKNWRTPDGSDHDFWDFMNSKNKQSQTVSRDDLFYTDWAKPDIY